MLAHEDSRLHRNAEAALALYRECAAQRVVLWTDDQRLTAEQQFDDGGDNKAFYTRQVRLR